MTATDRRRHPRDPNATLLGVAFGAALLVAGVAWAAVRLGYWWSSPATALPAGWLPLLGAVVRGRLPWTGACTVFAVGLGVALAAAAVAVAVLARRVGGRRPAIDRAAGEMGRGRALYPLTAAGAGKKARRLGVAHREGWAARRTVGFIGHTIGPTVIGNQKLVSDTEAGRVTFAGPRVGWKTTTWAIPQVLDAPGFAVATENKPGLCTATRDPRAQTGRVWVFDPMNIVGDPASWFWNPISVITSAAAAHRYATLYATASRPPDAREDTYFGPEGVALLGNLLLAAACGGQQLPQVYRWATTPNDTEPVQLLEAAGYDLPARAVRGVIDAPAKERGGIYGGVRRTLAFLLNDALLPWITPDRRRPAFDPAAFVRSTDTLYLLSREGVGSTGPLVLALTVAVADAAEAYADTCPGGRLPTPGTFVLDEAANIVRWPDLPALYSHYGSKGLLMDTILQSPAQGARVWGRDGLAQLVASATVMIYGGGVRDVEWLAQLGQMVGHWRPTHTSATTSRAGWSTSRSEQRELTLDVSDLMDLDPSRAVVFGYGAPATVVRKVPWWNTGHKAAVQASLDAHAHAPGTAPPAVPVVPVEVDVPTRAELRATPWGPR